MKKFVALVIGAMFVLGSGGVASAEKVTTPLGTLAVAQDGYIVVADGNSGNPDPFDGYIGVNDDPGCAGATAGGPYHDNGDFNPDHIDNDCDGV